MVRIVPELPIHIPAREALLDASFGAHRRTKTSERLREGRLPAPGLAFSLVDDRSLLGTLRLWPICAGAAGPALLLGPLAIEAARRSEGLGGALMRHGLAEAWQQGHDAVLLVGDAAYYERFGFSADLTHRLWLPGPYERERFLGLELREGALGNAAGKVDAIGELADVQAWPQVA